MHSCRRATVVLIFRITATSFTALNSADIPRNNDFSLSENFRAWTLRIVSTWLVGLTPSSPSHLAAFLFVPELRVVRSFCIIAIVAALSAVISGLENAQADRSGGADWVRTVDGWEHASVLDPDLQPSVPPTLHPLLVASFELGASLFVLLAFPHAPKPQKLVVSQARIPARPKIRRATVKSEV